MLQCLCLVFTLYIVNAIYLNDYDDITHKQNFEDIEFDPVVNVSKDLEKSVFGSKINCDDFPTYAMNCTVEAALIYNSSRKSPPLPPKINDWCKAIKHLTNCASEWNGECKDVSSHFSEASIKGHVHVLNSVCEDEWFLIQYEVLASCIQSAMEPWETCYSIFRDIVDEQKNSSLDWTHYDTHFNLCCARASFRRCTLVTSFEKSNCSRDEANVLQKFSVIISEGDVFQDCERNMMYAHCPGGDPRPTRAMFTRLTSGQIPCRSTTISMIFLLLSMFCILFN